MKRVVSNHDVAHLFALQSQSEAMNSNRSFYFEGTELFSYGRHFCIAKFVDANTLLFTERTYSNTTAKQINYARQATGHIKTIFCPFPSGSHAENFNWWIARANEQLELLKRSRKPEKYIAELLRIEEKAKKYSEYFGIEVDNKLQALVSIQDKEKAEEYSREAAREEQERIAKTHKKELISFREFKRDTIYTRNGLDYVRVNDFSEYFETSQGVKIPIAVGLRFYELLSVGKITAGEKLMQYEVRDVSKDSISIGCHTITFKEIKKAVKSVTINTK
jgi:hypothetical protein